jgi:hypothetical protein
MWGATITVGVLALVASAMATAGNFIVAKDYPDRDPEDDLYLTMNEAVSRANYKVVARVFYVESLLLWSLFVLGLAGHLLEVVLS